MDARRFYTLSATLLLLTGLSTSAQAQELQEVEERPLRRARVVPTMALNLGGSYRHRADSPNTQKRPHLSLWGGAAFHPRVAAHSPYVALGAELEPLELPDGRDAYFIMPMAQAGWAWLGCYDDPGFLAATFACIKVYGMAGVRPGFPGDLPAARIGFGINSIFLPLVALHGNALLPSSFELIHERDPHGTRVLLLRAGIGF